MISANFLVFFLQLIPLNSLTFCIDELPPHIKTTQNQEYFFLCQQISLVVLLRLLMFIFSLNLQSRDDRIREEEQDYPRPPQSP